MTRKLGTPFIVVAFILLMDTIPEAEACNSNSTCTGKNEYCQEINWISPPCSARGICQCLPCYTTGDFSGFSWDTLSTLPCAPVIKLNYGDHCAGVYYEQYPSPHFDCIRGKVACLPGHNCLVDETTLAREVVIEGSFCVRMDDCAGEMICTKNQCTCYNIYERFDLSTGRCVKRELGDPCSVDDECKVSGRNWNGFTWDSAVCLNGACSCGSDNSKTLASYLDPMTGEVKTKFICVTSKGKVDLLKNESCCPDPVYYSDLPFVSVCKSGFVCISCPEDNNWAVGRCREITGTKPVCHEKPQSWTTKIIVSQPEFSTDFYSTTVISTESESLPPISHPLNDPISSTRIQEQEPLITIITLPENTDQVTNSNLEPLSSSSKGSTEATSTVPVRIGGTSTMLVPSTAGIIRQSSTAITTSAECVSYCRSDSDCQEINEECGLAFCTFPRPCRCKNGYQRDPASQLCVPIVQLKLGDPCDASEGAKRLPPHTICRDSMVVCNAPYYENQQNGMINTCVKVIPGSYGTRCGGYPNKKCLIASDRASDSQLWCDDHERVCLCYESFAMKWDDEVDGCKWREFGDRCSSDSECAVFGSLANGGYTNGGGACVNNRCDCSWGFNQANFSYFDPTTEQIRSKTICIHKSSQIGVGTGQRCTLDPIYFADNPLGQTRICQPSEVCIRCENDLISKTLPKIQGLCMKTTTAK